MRYYAQQKIAGLNERLLSTRYNDENLHETQCDWQVGEFSDYLLNQSLTHHALHTDQVIIDDE